MAWKRHAGILLGLCTAFAACDSPTGPLEDLEQPSAVEGPDLAVTAASWSRQASMVGARRAAAAVNVGSTIYVIGGERPSRATSTTVQAYDARTNQWSLRRSMPMARSWMNGATVINGRIYVSGSYLAKTLLVYNPSTDTWTRKADLPANGYYGGQGAIGGKLYVYGGGYKFWRYDPTTNRWTALASPVWGHSHSAFGVIAGKFYLAGGEEEYLQHKVVEVYDPQTNRWSMRAQMPTARSGVASAVLNGKLYVAGGKVQGGGGSKATFDVYDPATNTWSSKPPLPVARAFAAGAAAVGKFFVMGGELDDRAITGRVDSYSP